MFKDVWGGVQSIGGAIGRAVEYAAAKIPIIGPPIVAGIETVDVLIRGGGAAVTEPGGSTTRYGTSANPIISTIKSTSIAGIPVVLIGAGLVAWLLFRKKGGR